MMKLKLKVFLVSVEVNSLSPGQASKRGAICLGWSLLPATPGEWALQSTQPHEICYFEMC